MINMIKIHHTPPLKKKKIGTAVFCFFLLGTMGNQRWNLSDCCYCFLTSVVITVSPYQGLVPVSSSAAMTATSYKDPKVSPVSESPTPWLHGATTGPSAEVSSTCHFLP